MRMATPWPSWPRRQRQRPRAWPRQGPWWGRFQYQQELQIEQLEQPIVVAVPQAHAVDCVAAHTHVRGGGHTAEVRRGRRPRVHADRHDDVVAAGWAGDAQVEIPLVGCAGDARGIEGDNPAREASQRLGFSLVRRHRAGLGEQLAPDLGLVHRRAPDLGLVLRRRARPLRRRRGGLVRAGSGRLVALVLAAGERASRQLVIVRLGPGRRRGGGRTCARRSTRVARARRSCRRARTDDGTGVAVERPRHRHIREGECWWWEVGRRRGRTTDERGGGFVCASAVARTAVVARHRCATQ